MYTGYWIEKDGVFGPNGYTQSWIENGEIFSSKSGYTQYWIEDGQIYSSKGGYTQFWIENNGIHGPRKSLPWLGK